MVGKKFPLFEKTSKKETRTKPVSFFGSSDKKYINESFYWLSRENFYFVGASVSLFNARKHCLVSEGENI